MATGRAGTVAIWSLCVSNGDLVTVVLDIENDSDQIDHSRHTGGSGPRSEPSHSGRAVCWSPTSTQSAQTGSLGRRRRRHVWLGPRNERSETSSRGPKGPTRHHARPPTRFTSQPTC